MRDPPTPDSKAKPQKRLVKKSYDKDWGSVDFGLNDDLDYVGIIDIAGRMIYMVGFVRDDY